MEINGNKNADCESQVIWLNFSCSFLLSPTYSKEPTMSSKGKPKKKTASQKTLRIFKRTGQITKKSSPNADEELRKRETIFKYAGWGVVTSDATTNTITIVNPALAKMYGYEEAEMIGKRSSTWENKPKWYS